MDLALAVGVTLLVAGGCFAILGLVFEGNGYNPLFLFGICALLWGGAIVLAIVAILWIVWERV